MNQDDEEKKPKTKSCDVELTLKEVGRRMGLTSMQVLHIQRTALRKIDRALRRYYPDVFSK